MDLALQGGGVDLYTEVNHSGRILFLLYPTHPISHPCFLLLSPIEVANPFNPIPYTKLFISNAQKGFFSSERQNLSMNIYFRKVGDRAAQFYEDTDMLAQLAWPLMLIFKFQLNLEYFPHTATKCFKRYPM